MRKENKISNQIVGNDGLYYVCYEFSKRGWNVLPTSRNTKGVDIVIYNQDATVTHTIQVKSLRSRAAVPFGNSLSGLLAEYVVICRYVLKEKPEIFILFSNDVKNNIHRVEKDGKISYWLEYPDYEKYKDYWGWFLIYF